MKKKEKLFIRLSNWLLEICTGRIVILFLVIFLVFTALVLPSQAAVALEVSGQAGTPDLSFYYSGADLYAMAEAYGEEGRSEYIRARFTFDLIWPLVYTFFMAATISWLSKNIFDVSSRWHFANLVPLVGADLDYLENIFTSIVMARFPDLTPYLASLAGLVTALKWIFVGGATILIVVLLLFLIWRSMASRAGSK